MVIDDRCSSLGLGVLLHFYIIPALGDGHGLHGVIGSTCTFTSQRHTLVGTIVFGECFSEQKQVYTYL